MKRILLFVMTNLAVMVVLGIVINVFGLNRFLDAKRPERRRAAGVLRWSSASAARSSRC